MTAARGRRDLLPHGPEDGIEGAVADLAVEDKGAGQRLLDPLHHRCHVGRAGRHPVHQDHRTHALRIRRYRRSGATSSHKEEEQEEDWTSHRSLKTSGHVWWVREERGW